MHTYRFLVFQFDVFLFHSLSDYEFYASKVWVDEKLENVTSKDMWIYGANSIHLAAKFMPKGLELLLSSLDDNSGLVDIRSEYNCTPLHVAATSNDSLSTRYRPVLIIFLVINFYVLQITIKVDCLG